MFLVPRLVLQLLVVELHLMHNENNLKYLILKLNQNNSLVLRLLPQHLVKLASDAQFK